MSKPVAFVAGATGYTGRAVVDALLARGARTVAHVRPDSPSLATWTERWQSAGAEVDTTPWEPEALAERMAALRPTVVFALLGTTRKRARAEGKGAVEAYETIDYGLTMMIIEAVRRGAPQARVVYLSAAGLSEDTRNPYMAVRVRVERALREGTGPYTIVRPSFITGEGRDEARPGERIGAAIGNGLLGVAGLLGARKLRDRYRSIDNVGLAAGMVRVALDPAFDRTIVHTEQLR